MVDGKPVLGKDDILAMQKYSLCKEFGWLPSQMENEDITDIHTFIILLSEQRKKEEWELKNSSKK
jgi:hypothetical protein